MPRATEPSFQATSGTYESRDSVLIGFPLGDQYCVLPAAKLPAAICVPPTAVTLGLLAGKPTAGDCRSVAVTPLAVPSPEQAVEPLSPELATIVCPCALACSNKPFH